MSKSSAALEWYTETADPSVEAIESAVEDMLRSLPESQQQLLRARFGIGEDPRILQTIAAHLGLDSAQLKRLERRALRGLRRQAVLADAGREDESKVG